MVVVALFVAVLAVAFLMFRDEIGPLPLIGGDEESGNAVGVMAPYQRLNQPRLTHQL